MKKKFDKLKFTSLIFDIFSIFKVSIKDLHFFFYHRRSSVQHEENHWEAKDGSKDGMKVGGVIERV